MLFRSYRDDVNKGIGMLKQVVIDYALANIEPSYCNYSKSNAYVTFENGDKWSVLGARHSSRGAASNIAYIERSIDYDTYRTIILPTVKNYPFRAIHLWGEGNLHITDEVQLFPF